MRSRAVGFQSPTASGPRSNCCGPSSRNAAPPRNSHPGVAPRRLAPNAAAARIPASLTVRPDHHRPVSNRLTSPSDLLRVLHAGVGRARWGERVVQFPTSHSPPPTTAAWLPRPWSPPLKIEQAMSLATSQCRMDQALFSGHGYGCHGVRGVPTTPLILGGQLSEAKIALGPTL